MDDPDPKRRKLSTVHGTITRHTSDSNSLLPKTSPIYFPRLAQRISSTSTLLPPQSDGSENELDINGSTTEGTKDPLKNATGSSYFPRIESPNEIAQHLKATVHTMSSMAMLNVSSFQIETNRLLTSLDITGGSRNDSIVDLLHSVKTLIEGIQPTEPLSFENAKAHLWKTRKVTIPVPNRQFNSQEQFKVQFVRPAGLNVVGSYATKTLTPSEGSPALDLVVLMPDKFFSEKDYLNHRYFYKRAFYLACIAGEIRCAQNELRVEIEYTELHGSNLLPILNIRPLHLPQNTKDAMQSTVNIRILLATSSSFFPIHKTYPWRNCVRSRGEEMPTPFYNAAVRHDAAVLSYMKFVHTTAAQCPSFRDGCMLGRQWLKMRKFDGTLHGGGFGNFELTLLMAILLHTDGTGAVAPLQNKFDGIQMFQAILRFLAHRDLSKEPLLAFGSLEFPASSQPVFFDCQRGLNVLFKMSPSSYRDLQSAAQISIRVLNSRLPSQFEHTFLTRVCEAYLQFDTMVHISKASLSNGITITPTDTGSMQNLSKLCAVLEQSLGDRIKHFSIQLPPTKSWPVHATSVSVEDGDHVIVKLVTDSAQAARSLDRGPSPEDPRAVKLFQDFWGEVVELRRFRDGSISHSVVWPAQNSAALLEDILRYSLNRHFGARILDTLKFIHLDISRELIASDSMFLTNNERMQSAFKDLESTLRTIKGLPLHIRSVTPSSSRLRGIETYIKSHSNTVMPADVLIQFEGSGHWPDDLRAIQMTKTAVLLKLLDALLMTSQHGAKIIDTRIGTENTHSQMLNRSFLDITYDSICKFRIRIHHEREQLLLERSATIKATTQPFREDAAVSINAYKQSFVQRPLHTQAILKLATHFNAFSNTASLVKAWFSSHLLVSHVSEELLELLVARVFLHPAPWSVPSNSSTAFLRVLFFLSEWDWMNQPLIVDFSTLFGSGLSKSDYQQIFARFLAWRSVDPSLDRISVIAFTNFDSDGTTGPITGQSSRLVATRITLLARMACKFLERDGLGLNPMRLFKTSLKGYDFVLHVSSNPSAKDGDLKLLGAGKRRYKNFEISTSQNAHQLASMSPLVAFVQEVEEIYGNSLVLFYNDPLQQPVEIVAGIWNPYNTQGTWKASLGFSSNIKKSSNDPIRMNRAALLYEIARIGGDLIKRVESLT